MSERVQIGPRVDRETWESFKAFTREHRGQTKGEVGRLLDSAMDEYMDRDRLTRLEGRIDEVLTRLDELDSSHTHKASEAAEKTERIAAELEATDRTVIPTGDVHRVIEGIAGADPRTIRKYERQLKRHAHAYEHPSDSAVWTLNRDQWVKWAVEYINNNPTVERTDVIEDYPMQYNEIERLATEVLGQ